LPRFTSISLEQIDRTPHDAGCTRADRMEADARTDIFAFGAVVYGMATGRKAFEGTLQASVIGKILETDPPPMASLQSMTPSALDRVVRKCLRKDPDENGRARATSPTS
jgi:eukaryotic-like serine/threonine-protein kinase